MMYPCQRTSKIYLENYENHKNYLKYKTLAHRFLGLKRIRLFLLFLFEGVFNDPCGLLGFFGKETLP